MKVELLHILDCPNTDIAEANARAALDAIGFVDVAVELVAIRTEAEATNSPFGGSPTLLVDGVDLAMVDPAWLRRQIGVVLQENVLFNRTIRDNIAYGRPGAT